MDLYDRNGVPISFERWMELTRDFSNKRVLRTLITDAADPDVSFDVSTVWLGLDHGFGRGAPLIFETMVFGDDSDELATSRYATEADAHTGHHELVVEFAATMTDPIVMDVTEQVDRS